MAKFHLLILDVEISKLVTYLHDENADKINSSQTLRHDPIKIEKNSH